ncbi:MAG: autotransporter outer membrane beta-barrel domain-containing protein, partial [Alphaproteobacteria bacterium]|nr:autotransporter outer membrane beta-barrel domain-containing protein [Alphaproteobacteria bacterium]
GAGPFTLINSGQLIGSVKYRVSAIQLGESNNILVLEAPSFLIGNIILEGETLLDIKTGSSHSFRWAFSGNGEIKEGIPSASGPVPVFYDSDNRVAASFDLTHLDADGSIFAGILGRVSDLIAKRRFVEKKIQWVSWGASFLSNSDVEEREVFASLGGQVRQSGIAIGYDCILSPDSFVGLLLGSSKGDFNGKEIFFKTYKSETRGFFGSFYGFHQLGSTFVQAAFSGGISGHKDTRYINDNHMNFGIDEAYGEYSSYWFSPELTAGVSFESSLGLLFNSSIRLRYARQSFSAYEEIKSASNVSMSERDLSLLGSRLEVSLSQNLDSFQLKARAGLQYVYIFGQEDISLNMFGQTKNVSIESRQLQDAYGGLDFKIFLGKHINLTVGGELLFGDQASFITISGLDVSF